jgi:hypothetical protein
MSDQPPRKRLDDFFPKRGKNKKRKKKYDGSEFTERVVGTGIMLGMELSAQLRNAVRSTAVFEEAITDADSEHSLKLNSKFLRTGMGRSVKAIGGKVYKGTTETQPGWKYVKAGAQFPIHHVGSGDATVTDNSPCVIGCFNPVEIMNAQYLHDSVNLDSEQSSHFRFADTASTVKQLQWQVPAPLNEYASLSNYQLYNCEMVKAAVRFTNTGPNRIYVLWKVFYPWDERVTNPVSTDSFGFPANPASLRNLKVDGASAPAYDNDSYKSLYALQNTPGMRQITLGAANDASDISPTGVAAFSINVKDVLNRSSRPGMSSYSTSGDDTTGINIGDRDIINVNALKKDSDALSTHQIPMVWFWAFEVPIATSSLTPGRLLEVRAWGGASGTHNLMAEGQAEYTVRVFGKKKQLAIALDDPLM